MQVTFCVFLIACSTLYLLTQVMAYLYLLARNRAKIRHVGSTSGIQTVKKLIFIPLVVSKIQSEMHGWLEQQQNTHTHPCTVDLDLQDTASTRSHAGHRSSCKLQHTDRNLRRPSYAGKSQIPLCHLVADRSEAGRIRAASWNLACHLDR